MIGLARIVVAVALVAGAAARAGPPRSVVEDGGDRASVTVDRARIALQESVRLSVELETGPGEDGSLPAIGETLGTWRVVSSVPRALRRGSAGGVVRGADVVLEPFLPGEYVVPALEFRVRDERGGMERVITTDALKVAVDSVLDDSVKDVGPERGMIESVPSRAREWWAVGLSAAIVVLAAGGAIVVVRRMREKPAALPPEWKIARLELERLLARMEWTGEDARRGLDLSGAVLGGWARARRHLDDVCDEIGEDGQSGPGAGAGGSAQPGSEAGADFTRLEERVEEMRFSGTSVESGEARRVAEDVMRATSPAPAEWGSDGDGDGTAGEKGGGA